KAMEEFIFFGVLSALWLGILTSISPCPLATNIAAISYIGRRVDSSKQVFLTGLVYTLGARQPILCWECCWWQACSRFPSYQCFCKSI
ncbi:MAG: hypothetical protein ACWGMZ_11015, partial [Thermoguttaceae bacterium]